MVSLYQKIPKAACIMKYTSQRFVSAILVGIILNLGFIFFVQIACWGSLISVIVTAYLAGVTTPKDGALIGAIIFAPSSIVIIVQTILRANAVNEIGFPLTIVAAAIGLLFGMGLGGLFGLVVGKLYELVKDRIY